MEPEEPLPSLWESLVYLFIVLPLSLGVIYALVRFVKWAWYQ